jgi:hypothetical protein
MIFLRRTKPIVVRLYTDTANAHRLFSPKLASELKPSWLSEKTDPVRACAGLRKMFSSGFGIPLWSDLDMNTVINEKNEADGSVRFSDKKNYLDLQKMETSAIPSSKICMKMLSPWYAECDEEINFIATENMWSNPSRSVEFLSGVADFKYQHATNMFFYMDKKTSYTQLNAGDVPILWKPQSERKLVIESFYDPQKYNYLLDTCQHPPFRNFMYAKTKNILLSSK